MNQQGKNELVRVCHTLPAMELDCSGWESDIPDEAWSTGSFESPTLALPGVELDCSHWGRDAPIWLELVISFEENTPAGAVLDSTNRLIGAAHDQAPGLGLTYDFRRSRREGEDMVVALSPAAGAGTEQELRELAGRFRPPASGPLMRAAARVGRGAA